VSDLHLEKQNDPRLSTARGITIERSDECENASDSIRINRECDSNEINVSDSQLEKHSGPRISTPRGITID
jgi:uncharacterized protein YecT (DUF1311 family)